MRIIKHEDLPPPPPPHQRLVEEVKVSLPLIHLGLDGADVPRGRYGGDVDVAVVQELLDVISVAQDEHVLAVLVGQHDELGGFPRVDHLRSRVEVEEDKKKCKRIVYFKFGCFLLLIGFCKFCWGLLLFFFVVVVVVVL